MGRTNTKKQEARAERLGKLPQSERLTKSALIKKKEGRVLDAAEKHALKMSSEHGEMLRLWEKLRTLEDRSEDSSASATPASKKTAYQHKYPVVDKLMHLIEPKFASLVRTPSASRVIQSMIKYGSAEQVGKILTLIAKDFATNATDAYAHFVICALIRHMPHDAYRKLLAHVIPAVPQLVAHKFGIEVIHATYSSRWCSPSDRSLLLLAVFKDNVAVMKRWAGYPDVEEVLRQNPALQKRLLTRLFDLSDKLVSQKEAVGFPFVQRLVNVYVKCGTRDEVSELCDTLRPHIATIAATREGAPLASLAFSLTEPKKRKEVLHSLNAQLGELSTSKYAAPVVARLFDLLYDAQMLNKYVAKDLADHIGQVINSPYGYQILMHLLTPHEERKGRFLLPNWREHNLFSMENKEWNHHTWLTADYAKETVEICSKPAVTSHLTALPLLVKAFLAYATDEANSAKLNRHHAALIAREVLHVVQHECLYAAALKLTEAEVQVLSKLAPAQGKREREEAEEVHAQPAKRSKHHSSAPSSAPSSSVTAAKSEKKTTKVKAAKTVKKAVKTSGRR
ncbi:pumillio protein 8 putative (PUF8) [Leptomonas seymouri]|uniref:Pumillio protein 8 putative (PUF8) n=1 Tax=Leptomonas seymouri TaxID=5684 RepID=A0A0N1HWV1_LEPSE|nr:pumillio protein 8 putative (PUF8) [Leptomonas seymouri]|eukprot:KPI86652.1 pumillio protein 8 putative (PUF8) [Leptomonas seymouri]